MHFQKYVLQLKMVYGSLTEKNQQSFAFKTTSTSFPKLCSRLWNWKIYKIEAFACSISTRFVFSWYWLVRIQLHVHVVAVDKKFPKLPKTANLICFYNYHKRESQSRTISDYIKKSTTATAVSTIKTNNLCTTTAPSNYLGSIRISHV